MKKSLIVFVALLAAVVVLGGAGLWFANANKQAKQSAEGQGVNKNTDTVTVVSNENISNLSGDENNKNIVVPASAPVQKHCNVYTYQDKFYYGVGQHCLDKIVLRPVYFVARDQASEIIPDWEKNIDNISQKIKNFYESQFNGKMQISVEKSQLVHSDNDIKDYMALTAAREVRDKLHINLSDEYFSVLTVYYHSAFGDYTGGTIWDSPENNGSIVVNPWFWLQSDALCAVVPKLPRTCYGYINSGHEFGHSLGLAHPWEMDINKDDTGNIIDKNFHHSDDGNIMSYGGLVNTDPNNPLGVYYVMAEEKQNMTVFR